MRVELLLIPIFVALAAISFPRIEAIPNAPEPTSTQEALYLPSGRALHALSFGYKNFLSDVLWFKTISYFGKHFKTDRNYVWLKHMCGLVVDLNPRADHSYEFCSMMLSWELSSPADSNELLGKAIENRPDSWRFHYLRAMNYMLFLNDEEKARDDLVTASKLPDAPAFVARIAAKRISALDNPQTAIQFLTELIRNSKDESEKGALRERLKEIEFDFGITQLEKLAKQYNATHPTGLQSIDNFVAAGLLPAVPKDPFGGAYTYDSKSATFGSSTGHKRVNMLSRGTAFQSETGNPGGGTQ